MAGVPVCCRPPDGFHEDHQHIRGTTDGQGLARLTGILAGLRSVSAYSKEGIQREEVSKEVEVPSTGAVEVSLSLENITVKVPVTGRVLEEGRPVPGARVVLSKRSGGGKSDSATTDKKGLFRFMVRQPGAYRLSCSNGRRVLFEVKEGDRSLKKDLLLEPFLIEGRMVLEEGREFSPACRETLRLRLLDRKKRKFWIDPGSYRVDRDDSGGFAFKNLRQEEYVLRCCYHPRYNLPSTKIEFEKHYAGLMAGIRPWKKGEKKALDFELERAGGLRIRMPYPRGGQGPEVFLIVDEDRGIKITNFPVQVNHADELYCYFYHTLPAGRYVVEIWRGGWEKEPHFVEVRSGRITSLDIDLK